MGVETRYWEDLKVKMMNKTVEPLAVLYGVLVASAIYFLAVAGVFAAPPVRLAPANANTINCVKIGTGTWTPCPATATISLTRQSLWIANATTNTYVGTTDNTLAISTGITPIVIGPKSMVQYPLTGAVPTYFRSFDGNVGNICTDEVTYP